MIMIRPIMESVSPSAEGMSPSTEGVSPPAERLSTTAERGSPTAAELVRADREYLIHPLHHPVDNGNTLIYVRGCGVTVQDIDGKEYLDGLSGLWNVNVGHGRHELAEAAAGQMRELAYFSGYVGASN